MVTRNSVRLLPLFCVTLTVHLCLSGSFEDSANLTAMTESIATAGNDSTPERVSSTLAVAVTSKKIPAPYWTSWGSNGANSASSFVNYGKEFPPCQKQARCVPLKNRTVCYGAYLSYKSTSLDLLAENATSSEDAEKLIDFWHNLRGFPRCWAVVQSLICAVLVPKCENDLVDLPSYEMCRITRTPCRIVNMTIGWPASLRCDHAENFPQFCKSEARELRFSSNAFCRPPLVSTDTSSSWYDGWEGCGLQCHDPMFTEEDHGKIRTFIGLGSGLCLLCALFTVVTFFIDWKSANKYPALIIFYINWCFLIASVGWLAQFTPGARDDIICRQDGTVRKFEPSSGENLSCVLVFVMIYYFLMAAAIWFVMLTYSWYMSFKELGKIRQAIEAKTAYFHLVAWSLPLVLTITILAMAQVDGDSVSGICFVGHSNPYIRVVFVLIPVAAILAVGGFYLVRGLVVLVHLKIGSDDIISEKASAKIRETILRIAGFAALIFVFVLITFVCHVYEYSNRKEWDVSLRRYIICKSNLTGSGSEHCRLEQHPSVSMVRLHLTAVFGASILMSSWVWTASTYDAWKRFLRRAFNQPINEPIKLTKHKMIAKAFAKRRQMTGSRMSFSFQSTHDDPLGMNFDLNSNASQEVSSTWQAALPKFILRRSAIVGAGTLGLPRNLSASDLSQIRQSGDSRCARRHSLDSQISFHMSDRERKAYMAQARQQRKRMIKKRRNRAGDNRDASKSSSRVAPWDNGAFDRRRRGSSDASQYSDFGPVVGHHFLSTMKVNNIEKEAENAGRSTKSSLFNSLLGRSRNASSKATRAGGRRNFSFIRGLDTSSEEIDKQPTATVELPGQIEGDANENQSISRYSKKQVADDARSVVSVGNESLHKLGEQLSASILTRAVRDSQSDLEMGPVVMRRSFLVADCGKKIALESASNPTMNNNATTRRSTIVDLAMDSDNRDSSSC